MSIKMSPIDAELQRIEDESGLTVSKLEMGNMIIIALAPDDMQENAVSVYSKKTGAAAWQLLDGEHQPVMNQI